DPAWSCSAKPRPLTIARPIVRKYESLTPHLLTYGRRSRSADFDGSSVRKIPVSSSDQPPGSCFPFSARFRAASSTSSRAAYPRIATLETRGSVVNRSASSCWKRSRAESVANRVWSSATVGRESQIGGAEIAVASPEKRRADEQHHGQRDLDRDAALAAFRERAVRHRGVAAHLERLHEIESCSFERRCDADRRHRDDREDQRESEDAHVDPEVDPGRKAIRRDENEEQPDSPDAEQCAKCRGCKSEECAFREREPDEPRATRAKRRADRHLPATLGCAD